MEASSYSILIKVCFPPRALLFRAGIEEPAAVCMAVLISFYTVEGEVLPQPRKEFSKEIIRRMQLLLLERCPAAHIPAPLIKELNRHYLTPSHLQPASLN